VTIIQTVSAEVCVMTPVHQAYCTTSSYLPSSTASPLTAWTRIPSLSDRDKCV